MKIQLRQRLRKAWYKLTGTFEPVIRELPDHDTKGRVEREEYFYLAYMFVFFILFVVWLYFAPDLQEWLLEAFPSLGPIPTTYIAHGGLGLALVVIAMLWRQVKQDYVKRVSDKVNAYPWMTGTITEMTETGYTTKYFQIPVEDMRKLGESGDEVELWGNPGAMTVPPGTEMVLFTQAYVPDEHVMRQFLVICDGSIDDHLALKRFEEVWAENSWISIEKLVSKINFVVPARVQNQHPVMYVSHSARTIEKILKQQTPKMVDDQEVYAVERLYALTQGERLRAESIQQQARIRELEDQCVRFQRELLRRENQYEQEESIILTPEKEKVPIINLSGWKMYVFYAIIIFIAVGLFYLGGAYVGWW